MYENSIAALVVMFVASMSYFVTGQTRLFIHCWKSPKHDILEACLRNGWTHAEGWWETEQEYTTLKSPNGEFTLKYREDIYPDHVNLYLGRNIRVGKFPLDTSYEKLAWLAVRFQKEA